MNKETHFYDKLERAKKILVLDLGFLGDTVHLIPALNCIRKAFPDKELHVMVSEHIMSLMELTPWVDKVLGYPRFPKGPKWYQDFPRVAALRREHYDAVINLNGSSRSSFLTFLSGAPIRLGRVPERVRWFWRHLFTDHVYFPREERPIYKQSLECLKQLHFLNTEPADFNIVIPEKAQERLDKLFSPAKPYVHISPCATLDYKELPINILAKSLNQLAESHPNLSWALSCAPTAREKAKLDALMRKLSFKPDCVFDGNLSLVELAALIKGSVLHMGADSGALHVALMTGVPTVSWFRDYLGIKEWAPEGENHVVLVGESSPRGLKNIAEDALINAVNQLCP